MDREGFADMLHRLASGWSSKQYDDVAAIFTKNVVYTDLINYSFRDRTSLLEFFRDDGGHEQECNFHRHIFDVERQIGVAEYTYTGHFTYHGTVWIELNGDKIFVWREYQYRADTSHSENLENR